MFVVVSISTRFHPTNTRQSLTFVISLMLKILIATLIYIHFN